MQRFFGILFVLIFAQAATAQTRHALVIGIDAYENVPALENAVADARSVSQALQEAGFRTTRLENATRREINQAMADLLGTMRQGDEVTFFFAGHGVEIEGRNYLLPSDVPMVRPGQESLVLAESLPLDQVDSSLRNAGAAVRFLILDACRDNPFPQLGTRTVGARRGLAASTAPRGGFTLFSAGPGEAALDSLGDADTSPNSIFTRILLPLLQEPGLSVQEIALRVRSDVDAIAASVGHEQFPYFTNGLTAPYFIRPAAMSTSPATAAQDVDFCDMAQILWLQMSQSDDPAALRSFIERFGTCQAVMPLAEDRLREVTAAQDTATVSMEDCSELFPVALMALSSGDERVIESFLEQNAPCMSLLANTVGLDLASVTPRAQSADLRLSDTIDPALHAENWSFARSIGQHDSPTARIAVSHDLCRVATSDTAGGIQIFNMASGQRLSSFRYPTEGRPLAFVFHPMQDQLIVRNPFWDHVRVVGSTSGREVARWSVARYRRGEDLPLYVTRDKETLVIGGSNYRFFEIHERGPTSGFFFWSAATPTFFSFSSGDRYAAVGDVTGDVVIHDVVRGNRMGRVAQHDSALHQILYLNDDRMVLTISEGRDVLIWDATPPGGFMALGGLESSAGRHPIV